MGGGTWVGAWIGAMASKAVVAWIGRVARWLEDSRVARLLNWCLRWLVHGWAGRLVTIGGTIVGDGEGGRVGEWEEKWACELMATLCSSQNSTENPKSGFSLREPPFQNSQDTTKKPRPTLSLGESPSQNCPNTTENPRLTSSLVESPSQNFQNTTERPRPRFSVAESPFQNFLKSRWRSHVMDIISMGAANLTLRLDQALEEINTTGIGNILFSPFSLYHTLALTLLASRGSTYRNIIKILGLDSGIDINHNSEVVHRLLSYIIEEHQEMQKLNKDLPSFKQSSSMFVQSDMSIRDKFINIVKQTYKSDITQVDFLSDYETSQKMIKNWLKTAVCVGNDVSFLSLSKSTKLAIFSTMQFKGDWIHQFKVDATDRGLFYIGSQEQVSVDMMTQYTVTPFIECKELGLKMIGLPYQGSEVVMYVIVPDAIGMEALRAVKKSLTPQVIEDLIGGMKNRSHLILMPKMDLSSSLSLKNILVKLGLASLFDPTLADLSPLTTGKRLSRPEVVTKRSNESIAEESLESAYINYINSKNLTDLGIDQARNENPEIAVEDLLHVVRMSVNERGKEVDKLLDLNSDLKTDVFAINRPFLFFVRHNPTKSIWFWGSIRCPTPFNLTVSN
ncbi:hypothetical protein QAD02_001006 [Eretmocerus hayati]|uniref:Uncharacterized protein n=1 Tax=Eretmocerus hayati TaxID=131215 RepID=A0ACC2NHM2_9HYME|nr:hypothetical protein QAD02_001006 [Eretmocerus hayati]